MAAVHDSAGRGGGGEPKQKRARSLGVGAGSSRGSSSSATAPVSRSCAHPESAVTSLVEVMMEDPDALNCSMCYLPLKPPIFQCDAGNAVCSRCCDKLQAMGKYRRCRVMERLVESIRVPCPYAAYDCSLRPVYYDQESHRSKCAHAPCHCPGEACSFVGSMAALLDHCSTTHKWPCITTVKAKPNDRSVFTMCLHDGFNFLLADFSTRNKNQGSTDGIKCLLLMTVERHPYARVISVHCIDPHAAAGSGAQGGTSKEIQCLLDCSLGTGSPRRLSGNNPLIESWQVQSSRFRVVRTDLSNGLPKPDDCFQVVVPNSVIQDYDKQDGFKVRLSITIK